MWGKELFIERVPKIKHRVTLAKTHRGSFIIKITILILYLYFIHRTSPTTPLLFQFDETLIEDIPGKLQSSTLTVDNLTVDWLRNRLQELEGAVKDCQEKQLKMIEHVNGGSPVANGSIISNGSNTSNGIQSNKDSQW